MERPMPADQADAKIALITGASRGLGRATALALAKRGVGVIVTYNSHKDEGDSAVAEIQALGAKAVALKLDIGAIASLDGFVAEVRRALTETWGRDRFDFLVNNAGMGIAQPFAEVTEAAFDALLNVHFKGVFFLTQKLLPVIANGGRIVNLSSGLTRYTYGGMAVYAAMKGAIEVLTRYLAKELGPRGIAVNSVAPGAIETDFADGLMRDNPEFAKHVASITALGRLGVPDDIGPMIASLLSEDNRWVNAQRIEVSGAVNL
jgi:NAD(P)-dependent dehydrogenase (short-subunit alcohol dehydrogenase family)